VILVEESSINLWKFTQKFWNNEMPSFTVILVILNKIVTHYRSPDGRQLCSSSWKIFSHFWTLYIIVLQFLHSLYFGHKLSIIHYGFRQHSVFSVKKADNSRIPQLAGLSVAGHIITHCLETRTNTMWPVMWWFIRQEWRYLACASSSPFLHYLPKINGDYFPNSPPI
jgi:hypothetical protein